MKIEKILIDRLVTDPANARTHDKKNIEAIKGSLLKFGQQKPIVVNENGLVVAGNGTLEAARQLGWETIEIVRTKLTGLEQMAFALADNRTTDLSKWDDDILGKQLQYLYEEDYAIAEIGFDPEEYGIIEESLDNSKDDEIPETLENEFGVERGQIWQLGKHRIMCGDSTSKDDVDRLMAGEKADICFTSPPYALGKSASLSGNKNTSKNKNAYKDHEDNSFDWPKLMQGWFDASKNYMDAWAINVQMLSGNKVKLVEFINHNRNRLVDIIIWDKGHAAPAMAPGVLNSTYEFLLIFGQDGAKRTIPFSSWRGNKKSVYMGPPQRNNEFSDSHGATMPIHFPIYVLNELCDKTVSVYEPFCGTGTTLIACEKTNRKCYGMEIDPHYCSVIIKRWQDFTGKQATLVNGK